MRMRVTKPDFWESEEICRLSVFARLLLKAVGSYVDDNGVQKDSAVGIAAECYRYDLARDAEATIRQIESGLIELWEAGFVVRYTVNGVRYLHGADWEFWQKPRMPSKPRYPTSTSPGAVITPVLPEPCSGSAQSLYRDVAADTETEPGTEPEFATRGMRDQPWR